VLLAHEKDALQQSLRASLNVPFAPSDDAGYSELATVSPDLIAEYPRLICGAPAQPTGRSNVTSRPSTLPGPTRPFTSVLVIALSCHP
jgi:hypothetical protein